MLKIFSSLDLTFAKKKKKNSSLDHPHFGASRRTSLPQKVECLPRSDHRNFYNNDRSLLIYSLTSFNCFTYIDLFQNSPNDMS